MIEDSRRAEPKDRDHVAPAFPGAASQGTLDVAPSFRMSRAAPRLSFRAKVGATAGKSAAALSRALGRGAGGMFGGKVAMAISPTILTELTRDKRVVLVTGTNGKSTTTGLTAAALETLGKVATNSNGDNMETGIVTALMQNPDAPYAVLEVDEMHMPRIAAATNPAAIILLNLSRDQLDRVGEIGNVEMRLRDAVTAAPGATIIANCDDPLVSSAAWDAPNVQWVSVGAPWTADATSFPRTGTLVVREGDDWHVEGSDQYRRPAPDWTVSDADDGGWFSITRATDEGSAPGSRSVAEEWPVGAAGGDQRIGTATPSESTTVRTRLQVPGRANRGNAAQAAAAAAHFGVKPEAVGTALSTLAGVAGRYQNYDVDGRDAHMLLAKNPAGWQEALAMIAPGTKQLVLATNAQVPDGEDMSWVWDVGFEQLGDLNLETVVVSGERAEDLAVRLEYAGVPFRMQREPLAAIRSCDPGKVEVLANYTAFRDLKKELDRL